ncbi:MAG TPA: hypothetical protein VGM27_22360 [Acidobacteriaceae bacterium]
MRWGILQFFAQRTDNDAQMVVVLHRLLAPVWQPELDLQVLGITPSRGQVRFGSTTYLQLQVRGTPLSSDGLDYIVRQAVKADAEACPNLLSKRVTPHVLRHTWVKANAWLHTAAE